MLFCLATLAILLRINNSTWRFCLALATFLRREGGSTDICAASPRRAPTPRVVYLLVTMLVNSPRRAPIKTARHG
jgi:hypothetical protein